MNAHIQYIEFMRCIDDRVFRRHTVRFWALVADVPPVYRNHPVLQPDNLAFFHGHRSSELRQASIWGNMQKSCGFAWQFCLASHQMRRSAALLTGVIV